MIAAEVLAVGYDRRETSDPQPAEGPAGTLDVLHVDDGLGLTFWIRREEVPADKERSSRP